MAIIQLSLRDAVFLFSCILILVVEWNLGSNLPLEEQLEHTKCIGCWSIVFTLYSLIPFPPREIPGESFTLKGACVSLMQQVTILAVGLAAVALRSEPSLSEWMSSGKGPSMTLERHSQYMCMGALLKDFWLPDHLDMTFIIHHLMGVAGCGVCLVLPAGFGAATVTTFQAEFTSGLWNAMFILPSFLGSIKVVRKLSQWIYMVGMAGSHIGVLAVGYMMANKYTVASASPTDPWWTWWRILYCSLDILLVSFRIIGQVVYGKKIISSDWNPLEPLPDKRK